MEFREFRNLSKILDKSKIQTQIKLIFYNSTKIISETIESNLNLKSLGLYKWLTQAKAQSTYKKVHYILTKQTMNLI